MRHFNAIIADDLMSIVGGGPPVTDAEFIDYARNNDGMRNVVLQACVGQASQAGSKQVLRDCMKRYADANGQWMKSVLDKLH